VGVSSKNQIALYGSGWQQLLRVIRNISFTHCLCK
jgi:hypothetical protein